MNDVKRTESGASEVIGAVLLVSLVVIGGAIIAAYTFGQPAPKEVPHVNFGVSLDNKTQNLTLHHTGGDTLLPGEYNVTVYDTYGVPHIPANPSDTSISWSADESLNITHVTYAVGDVVLSYIDKAGGNTVLRRVPFEDHSLRGTISGYKYNVTGGQRAPWTVTDPQVKIRIYRKEGSNYNEVPESPVLVDTAGHYSYTLPVDVWGVYKVQEEVPNGWEAVNPPHGYRQVDVSTSSPAQQVIFENRLIPVTTTRTTRPTTVTTAQTSVPTTTPIPTKTISGHKYRVDGTGAVQGTPPVVTITLDLVSPRSIDGFRFPMTTTTDPVTGAYSFTVPDVTATYRLTESGFDLKSWFVFSPTGGIIDGVAPGGTNYDFKNMAVLPNGVVMFLNKTVDVGCPGGHVVDGTTLEGEARGSNSVKFLIGGAEQTYKFSNNEQFRFTIVGDQDVGDMQIDHFEMKLLKFNVKFEVRPDRNSAWRTPTSKQFNPTGADIIGIPIDIYINAINKNLLNEDSTLEYHHPVCSDNQTLLRLNGQVRIDSPSDDTELKFTNLHEVHDNRYGEGLNTMWIHLYPGYDYLLAQGVCVYP